jgi:CheY-like chemotaxis protein
MNWGVEFLLHSQQFSEMGGLEATKIIKDMSWKDCKKPVIVAMTASASDTDKEVCHAAGMDFYLSKPMRIEEMKRVLEIVEQGKRLKCGHTDSN